MGHMATLRRYWREAAWTIDGQREESGQ